MAFEFGRYRLHIESPERTALIETGRYVQVHERDTDGSWHKAVEMFTPRGGE
jgi:hypothetical protein